MFARFFGLMLLTVIVSAQTAEDPVVSVVNGKYIRESDLHIEQQLLQIQRQEFEMRRRALRDAISRRLLETAAVAKGMDTEQFMAEEYAKIEPPTEEALRGFFLAQIGRYQQRPFEKARTEVLNDFVEAEKQIIRSKVTDRLAEGADIRVLIHPPRTQVDLRNSPRYGPPDAKVTIVEFADFECPYCKAVEPTLKAIQEKYGDRVAVVFKDFPLTEVHPRAQLAAEAGRCAQSQGKFWTYHDLLFGSSPNLGKETLRQVAIEANLELTMFDMCIKSGAGESEVAEAAEQGKALGVEATPTFFINGIILTGAAALRDFEEIIDAELASTK